MKRCAFWYKYFKKQKKTLKNTDQDFSLVKNYAFQCKNYI